MNQSGDGIIRAITDTCERIVIKIFEYAVYFKITS